MWEYQHARPDVLSLNQIIKAYSERKKEQYSDTFLKKKFNKAERLSVIV